MCRSGLNLEVHSEPKNPIRPASSNAGTFKTRRTLEVLIYLASPCRRRLLPEVGRIIPQRGDPKALPRHEEIPEIPLVEDNTVTAKLTTRRASTERSGVPTGIIVTLKVITSQHRTRSRRRAGQQPLRAPYIDIMPDQEVPRLLIHTEIIIRVPVTVSPPIPRRCGPSL